MVPSGWHGRHVMAEKCHERVPPLRRPHVLLLALCFLLHSSYCTDHVRFHSSIIKLREPADHRQQQATVCDPRAHASALPAARMRTRGLTPPCLARDCRCAQSWGQAGRNQRVTGAAHQPTKPQPKPLHMSGTIQDTHPCCKIARHTRPAVVVLYSVGEFDP